MSLNEQGGPILRRYLAHRLDISYPELAYAATQCIQNPDAASAERRLMEGLRDDSLLPALSVRSGLDLLLSTLKLPPGSEMLMSAITHPDMIRLVQAHGLRPVPVDIDERTLEPRFDIARKAVTDRTRAFMLTRLFGSRSSTAEFTEFTRQHGLFSIEDSAQFLPPPHLLATGETDATLYSFGPLKTATALGGALVHARGTELLNEMRVRQASFTVQPTGEYTARVMKFALALGATLPTVTGLLMPAARTVGLDAEAIALRAARGLGQGLSLQSLLRRIRRQPSGALLAVLQRRLVGLNQIVLSRSAERGEELQERLPSGILHPGRGAETRNHWLFPILTSDAEHVLVALRNIGIHAGRRTASLACVPSPVSHGYLPPSSAASLLEDVIFLPAYPSLPREMFERMIGVLSKV
jgi:perosamine synthetase